MVLGQERTPRADPRPNSQLPSRARVKLDICVSGLLPQLQRPFDPAVKAGSMSSGRPWWRSPRRTKIILSSLLLLRERRRDGALQKRGRNRFGSCLTGRKGSNEYQLSLKKRSGELQEFVFRWSADGGNSFREIVRQQWNFSPPETIREVEEYQVELASVTVLELIIVPNVSGGSARASLKSLRLS